MKLARYLADYIEHEREVSMTGDIGHKMEEIIQQGLEAFASTENIELTSEDFAQGWKHFCDRVSFDFMDAEAIRFMNETPGKIMQILKGIE